METQRSIFDWQLETFGPPKLMRSATRINEEVAELLVHMSLDDYMKIPGELADIAILITGLAAAMWIDLQGEVDKKMAINRKRRWGPVIGGHAQHLREESK